MDMNQLPSGTPNLDRSSAWIKKDVESSASIEIVSQGYERPLEDRSHICRWKMMDISLHTHTRAHAHLQVDRAS